MQLPFCEKFCSMCRQGSHHDVLSYCLPYNKLYKEKSSIFWDTILGSTVNVSWCFGGTHCRHPHVGFLFGLLFGPEDGGDEFLRNISHSRRTAWRYIREVRILHSQGCENLRFKTVYKNLDQTGSTVWFRILDKR
jgi:hypothetical protein